MKVEIWSDVMCPFCYIGKHRFEQALKQFDYADDIDIDWKSFQLNPNLETQPGKNIAEHLAEIKDWSIERADQMNRHVSTMASEAGLNFNLDKAVIANSFDAHRLVHFAKTNGKGNEAEESLFKAYFTKGQNIDDIDTLVELGESLGLNNEETRLVLESDKFANAVKQDILAARNLGVQGVPFFLFNRKYAISGARDTEVFEQALRKSWQEWNNESPMEPAD